LNFLRIEFVIGGIGILLLSGFLIFKGTKGGAVSAICGPVELSESVKQYIDHKVAVGGVGVGAGGPSPASAPGNSEAPLPTCADLPSALNKVAELQKYVVTFSNIRQQDENLKKQRTSLLEQRKTQTALREEKLKFIRDREFERMKLQLLAACAREASPRSTASVYSGNSAPKRQGPANRYQGGNPARPMGGLPEQGR
jgi:hypothetical protein